MFINLNIVNDEELEIITSILLNKIINSNKKTFILDDRGIDEVIDILRRELNYKLVNGNLGSLTNLDYNENSIIRCARKLLEHQRGLMRY